MVLGKAAITLSSDVQIRWSWTLWKAYSEDYTTQLSKGSKTKWINPEFHSKIQPRVRSTTKTIFANHDNSKWSPTGWSTPLSLSYHCHKHSSKDFHLLSRRHSILTYRKVRLLQVALDDRNANKFAPLNSTTIYPKSGHALLYTTFDRWNEMPYKLYLCLVHWKSI